MPAFAFFINISWNTLNATGEVLSLDAALAIQPDERAFHQESLPITEVSDKRVAGAWDKALAIDPGSSETYQQIKAKYPKTHYMVQGFWARSA